MDEADLRMYRALLAQSDDIHDEAEHEVRLAQGEVISRREGRLPQMGRRPSPREREILRLG